MKRLIIWLPVLLLLFGLASPAAAHYTPTETSPNNPLCTTSTPIQCMGIEISLQAKGADSRTVPSGSDVPFQITLTNTGDTGDLAIQRIWVNVENLSSSCEQAFTFSAASFGPGDSFSYTCTAPNVTSSFTAKATVYATRTDSPFGGPNPDFNDVITDSDASEVLIEAPPANAAIDIVKFVEFPSSGGDLCATFGKPKILTMKYTGGNSQSHTQDSGKVTVNDVGPLGLTDPVFIRATDKDNPTDVSGKVWFSGVVNLGDPFAIDATAAGQTRLSSDTRVHIFDSTGTTLLQSVKFHTSCSQPLELGNQFGGIQLAGFQDENDATTQPAVRYDANDEPGPSATVGDPVVWTYDVTNTGAVPLTGVTVTDDQGVAVNCPKDMLAPQESMTCSASGTVVAGQYGNVGTATGNPPVGDQVSADDPAHYFGIQPVVDQCANGAKPQVLTMTYTGDGDDATSHHQASGKVTVTGDPNDALTVFIRANDKDDPADLGGHIYFEGNVNLGGTFDINSLNGGSGHLGGDTRVHIFDSQGNELQFVKFHTSCSQPLFIGDQFGGIQLAGFTAE